MTLVEFVLVLIFTIMLRIAMVNALDQEKVMDKEDVANHVRRIVLEDATMYNYTTKRMHTIPVVV